MIMTDKQSSYECTIICWALAALAGFAAMGMLYFFADFSGLQAVFTGGLVGFLLGAVLSLFVCRSQTASADLVADEKPAQRYAREAAEKKASRQAASGLSSAAATGGAAPASSLMSSADAGAASSDTAATAAANAHAEAPAGAAPAAAKPEATTAHTEAAAPKAAASKTEAPKAAAPKAETPKAEPAKPAPAAATAQGTATGAADTGGAPKLYTSAPAEGSDDLKLISGVGPKLEQTLNEIGIYRFEQVADWGPTDIAYVDDRLRFKGRIERDDWMAQAKILAAGGETEFSARKK